MTTEQARIKYQSYIVHDVAKHLGLPVKDVWHYFHLSGIAHMLDEFNGLAYHWPPEEWVPNLEAYIKRQEAVI